MKKHVLSTMLLLLMSSSVHTTVTVTWAADATANIQAAIDTGDPNVVIPNVASDWVVAPLFLNSNNQQITFSPGVVVRAKAGAYSNLGDCMFAAVGKTNITLTGYGATLRMLKSEYTAGEWRHTISFKTCSTIKVLGLTALDSGGDGVFIADSYAAPYCCTDVLIKDCVFNNHRRLGAAVVSGKNVTFENCVFSNSIGTAPQAGVDLEPDQINQRLENIDFYNCFATGNSGSGYVMATSRLNSTSTPIDVELHRCYAQDQVNSYELFLLPATTAGGTYKATDCSFVSDAKATLWAERNFASGVAFLATRCRFESKNQNPIRIMDSAAPQCGNLTFTDCVAHYQGTNPYISWEIFDGANSGITNIAGNIDVYNPNGARVNWGSNYSNITLLTTPHNTRVPVVTITAPTMGATLAPGDTLTFAATAYDPDTGTADGNGMSQVIFEVWRCDNATNTLKASTADPGAAYLTTIGTSGWAQGIYMLVARGLSADGSEKRRITYIRVAAGGGSSGTLITNAGTGTLRDDFTGTVGLRFTVGSSNLTITQLGFFDDDTDGNAVQHQVGIWTDAGVLLGSAIVQAGTASTLSGEFRYATLPTPITLTAGQGYRLGSYVSSGSLDRWHNSNAAGTYSSGVTVSGSPWISGPFAFPNTVSPGQGFVGPNMKWATGGSSGGTLITDDGSGTLRDDFTGTVGLRFVVGSSNLTVTQLGFYDDDLDGNVVSHQVGIWTEAGVLLGSATVQAGTGSVLSGEFRYVTLGTPITLTAGQSYRLGSYVSSGSLDRWHNSNAAGTYSSSVAVGGSPWISGSFAFPNTVSSGSGFIGPNMKW